MAITEIVTPEEAATWLRQPALKDDPSFVALVALINNLAIAAWKSPVTPIPARVRLIVLNAVARGWGHAPGRGSIESYTRSIDDASRTERYRTHDDATGADGFFTLDDLALLAGRRRGAARTIGVIPSW